MDKKLYIEKEIIICNQIIFVFSFETIVTRSFKNCKILQTLFLRTFYEIYPDSSNKLC